jgi:hypothetical protein
MGFRAGMFIKWRRGRERERKEAAAAAAASFIT